MNVAFVEPCFPENQTQFVRALAGVGARVIGIGERPAEALDDETRRSLAHYERIGSVCDEDALLAAVRRAQAREWIDRLEATVEAHIMPTARVREAAGIPGTSTRTAYLCRDKPAMKEALRAGGIPCAASAGASSESEVRAFAERVGFPLIVKPRDAAGASGTSRVDDWDQLERTVQQAGFERGASVAVEEFVEGHEGFYDTITIGGRVVHEFVTHYYPNVLEAMRARWISPQFIATNRIDSAPGYDEIKDLGRRVLPILGIETSATHMEWFYGPKGLRFSEIGCRPPGVRTWDLYNAGNDIDLYHEWAMAVVHGRSDRMASRRFAAGIIALRPDRDGRITGYDGAEEVRQAVGEQLIDFHLPPPGTPTQPVEAGYMANAWVRLRHPDYDALREQLDFVGRTLKVRAA
jgi:carbamoylphosphate synthase large subunit